MMTLYPLKKPFSSLSVARHNIDAHIKMFVSDRYAGTLVVPLDTLMDTTLAFADVVRPLGWIDGGFVVWDIPPIVYGKDICIGDTGDIITVDDLEVE